MNGAVLVHSRCHGIELFFDAGRKAWSGMKIGIDARPLSKRRTGVETYVEELLAGMARSSADHEYLLYSNRDLIRMPDSEKLVQRIDRRFQYCPGAFWLWGRGARLAARDGVKAFWSTYPMLPAGLPRDVLKIMTIYDLVWPLYSETTNSYVRVAQRLFTRRALFEADRIVVISRTVQEQLLQHFNIPKEKTLLIYPGVGDNYKPVDREEAAGYISEKYKVSKRYMATVGIVVPRKNLKLLVEAARILKSRGQLDCQLLIAGASGWENSGVHQAVRAAGLSDSELHFMGYLPDEDLPMFYAGAQLFLFPSLYEGFGFPPVEAMACGTPVLASNAPCMPEVLGKAAILSPPDNAERFAEEIVRIVSSRTLAAEMREMGLQRARDFRWEASASEFLSLFQAS